MTLLGVLMSYLYRVGKKTSFVHKLPQGHYTHILSYFKDFTISLAFRNTDERLYYCWLTSSLKKKKMALGQINKETKQADFIMKLSCQNFLTRLGLYAGLYFLLTEIL